MGSGLDLFSEVEAKRVALEQNIITMRTQHALTQKKLEVSCADC